MQMTIPFYMYTQQERDRKQKLLNTFNELNHKYPKWTFTTTEMIQADTDNMAKLFVYLVEHTMTEIASINVQSDTATLYQLRDHKPTSPAQWKEILEDMEENHGAAFINGVNNDVLSADQLYQIMMALDKDEKPTRAKVEMDKFQGNFYRSSAMPKSPYQLTEAELGKSAKTKLQFTSFEGKEFDVKQSYPHTYLLTPRAEEPAIKDIIKTLKGLDFVTWPKPNSIEETVILQQFVKGYRAMVLNVAAGKRPLLYVHEVDDVIKIIDALANHNNRVDDWTDKIEEIDNRAAFNHVMNNALVSGQMAAAGQHKIGLKTYQYENDNGRTRYLYSFVDENYVKTHQTPNAVLEVDVIPQVQPLLNENGQVMHEAEMMDKNEYQKYIKSHQPTASKKHRTNRKKK